jgi:hypothetical protein
VTRLLIPAFTEEGLLYLTATGQERAREAIERIMQ